MCSLPVPGVRVSTGVGGPTTVDICPRMSTVTDARASLYWRNIASAPARSTPVRRDGEVALPPLPAHGQAPIGSGVHKDPLRPDQILQCGAEDVGPHCEPRGQLVDGPEQHRVVDDGVDDPTLGDHGAVVDWPRERDRGDGELPE